MMGSFLQIVMVLLVSRLFPQMLVLQSQLSQQQVPPARRGTAVAENWTKNSGNPKASLDWFWTKKSLISAFKLLQIQGLSFTKIISDCGWLIYVVLTACESWVVDSDVHVQKIQHFDSLPNTQHHLYLKTKATWIGYVIAQKEKTTAPNISQSLNR